MKKNKFGKWLLFVFYILAGIIFSRLTDSFDLKLFGEDATITEMLLYYCILLSFGYITLIIHIIIHEAGHLIFGLLSGYKFVSFRIFNILFIKQEGKVRCKRYSLMGTAGQCLMAPPEPYTENLPTMLYNFGGVIAGLIASALTLALFFLFKNYIMLALFFLMSTLMGVVVSLINGIPMYIYPIYNDGYNALNIKRHEAAKRAFWTQLKINELQAKGIRLKDMPDELFCVSDDDILNSDLFTAIRVFTCNRAIDALDFETAKKIGHYLLENAQNLIGLYRNIVTMEMIFCELIGKNRFYNIEKLESKDFINFIKASSKMPYVNRFLYAYELFYHHDEQAAQKQLEKFEKAAENTRIKAT